MAATAAMFPLAAEGNLASGNGGSGDGSHWSAGIGLLDIQFLVPDDTGAPTPITSPLVLPSSDPRPQIQLDPITTDMVAVSDGTATVSVSGTVTCSVADIVPDDAAAISEVQVCLDSGENLIATLPVTWDHTGDTASLFHPHAGHGTFSGTVSFPLGSPLDCDCHELIFEAYNALNKPGMTCVTIGFSQKVADGQAIGTPTITDVSIGDPLPEDANPILVQLTGPSPDMLEAQLTTLYGSLFGQTWTIENIQSSTDYFLFGAAGSQTVFMIASDLPPSGVPGNVVDGFAIDNPITARVYFQANGAVAANKSAPPGIIQVEMTHVFPNIAFRKSNVTTVTS